MISFEIPAISCGHCVQAVTEAVQSVDPGAQVRVDLATHRVVVETTAARAELVARLTEAGYAPAASPG